MSKKSCDMITLCEEICYKKPHIFYSVSMIPVEVLKTYIGTCCFKTFNGIISTLVYGFIFLLIQALSNFSDVHMKKKLLIFAILEIMPNQKWNFDEIQRAANKPWQLKLNFTKQKSTSHTEQNKVISEAQQEPHLPNSGTVIISKSSFIIIIIILIIIIYEFHYNK